MSLTFSINIGTTSESTRKSDIFSVLNDIPDNTQKLISPRDVRDAFFSTWANIPFKLTTPNTLNNTYEYIGIDSSNPNNRDIKSKILIGKRSFGGLDVMSSGLLSSTNTSDIFFFNTKSDSESQDSTKISILSGTNSGLYIYAPYIESKATASKIDLNLINPNGVINIKSLTSRVAINNIQFPTVAENTLATNGQILKYYGNYPNGYLKWDIPSITFTNIGTTSSDTNIYGATVSINGASIEFVDDNIVPEDIGGILQGMSFSANTFNNGSGTQNWPVVEVLKELLFPYVEPILELNIIGKTYSEIGTTPSITLTYSITTFQKNSSEKIVDWQITNTSLINQSFDGLPGQKITGTLSTTASSVSNTWSLKASNMFIGSFSYSVNTNMNFVYPVYYGYSNTIITQSSFQVVTTNNLIKYINKSPLIGESIELPYSGSGYIYIVYPNTYNSLKEIRDPNGFIIYDSSITGLTPNQQSFTFSNIISPIFGNSYKVFRSKNISSYTQSTTNKFKFKF